jgi:hypothetical protein
MSDRIQKRSISCVRIKHIYKYISNLEDMHIYIVLIDKQEQDPDNIHIILATARSITIWRRFR